MGSHQETRGGMRYRCRPHSATGHAPRRAARSTQEPRPRSQSARGRPTATERSRDGANPSCATGHPQTCSMSNLPSEIRFLED
jgi:hypothetical protein